MVIESTDSIPSGSGNFAWASTPTHSSSFTHVA